MSLLSARHYNTTTEALLALDHKARTLLQEPVSKIWVYSLAGTDYDGHLMLPHFLAHYGSLGVPHSQFHFDLLHDTEEDDTGLKVCTFIMTLLLCFKCKNALNDTKFQYCLGAN